MKTQKQKAVSKQKKSFVKDKSLKSNFDYFGSYTGVSVDKFDKPVQDADDL